MIMTANEFRIGNWLQLQNGKHVQIEEVMRFVPTIAISNGCRSIADYNYDELMPIPLTHEILESYGFEVPRKDWDARVCPLNKVWIGDYDNTQKRVWINSNYCGILHLQYLHELQNLYFAICGTELTKNGLLDGK